MMKRGEREKKSYGVWSMDAEKQRQNFDPMKELDHPSCDVLEQGDLYSDRYLELHQQTLGLNSTLKTKDVRETTVIYNKVTKLNQNRSIGWMIRKRERKREG